MKMIDLLNSFLQEKKLNGLSFKSIKDYKEFLVPFIEFAPDELLDVSIKVVNSYFDLLLHRNISKSTYATYVRNVKIFLVWIENNYNFDIAAKKIKVPKSPKKNPYIYSDSDIKQIFNLIYNGSWLSLRNCSIVALMLDSGLRQNEISKLTWSNIFIDSNYINVTGKGSKDRIVPLGSISKHYLLEYKNCCPFSSNNVFVTCSGDSITDNTIKLFMRKYSLKLPFEFSSHKLRHNFATNFLIDSYYSKGSMDVYALMSILGHENLETTKRYLHIANQVVYSRAHISHIDKIFLN